MLPSYDDNSRTAFLCSLILHIIIAYLFFYGLPSSLNKTLPQEEVIIFEMLPVADVVNIPIQKKQQVTENKVIDKSITEENKKIAPPIESKPIQPEVPEPSPKEEIIAEQPALDKTVEKKIEPVVIPEAAKKEPVKILETKKKEIKTTKTKEKEKVVPQTDLDSLLKNLEKSSAGKSVKLPKQAKADKSIDDKDMMGLFDEELPLSVTETSIIKAQIQKHWHPPLGGQNASKIKIIFHIEFNTDGSVQKAVLDSKNCAGTATSLCEAFVVSAERAIWQASPIVNLPPERYNVWKSLNFNFDPSNLLK